MADKEPTLNGATNASSLLQQNYVQGGFTSSNGTIET